ncbi:DUF1707 domain-containing protein [Nocardia sp. IFM 10818]
MSQEHMRASDADRQQIVNRLQLAMNEGRLSLHEFDERLQQVYSAKTYGELSPILSDLPAQRTQRAQPAGKSKGRVPQWITIMWIPWVFVNALMVLIWLATGLGYFWPFWVAVPWGLALLIPTTIGMVVDGDDKRVEKAREKHGHRP